MQFELKGPLKDNIYNLMRKIGYLFLYKDEGTGEMSFVNPVGAAGRNGYPRFHIYSRMKGEDLALSLHLDQKRPIYEGTTAHSGEYDSELVEKEVKRIEEILKEDAKN